MDGPLKNLLVLDLTRVLVGPYCTMMLSDLGARVIKVEAPEVGDDSRNFGPFIEDYSAYFMSLNRGKESIALNLKNSDDKKIFDKILAKADILVENFKPGTLEKWGYGWKDVCEKYPKLIYASASGFGQTGPLKELPAYDMVVQGMGGLMSVTGQPNSEPTRVGTSIGDITAGLFTTIGINAALYDRQKTGKGMYIDVSMLDCQISMLNYMATMQTMSGVVPEPIGNSHFVHMPYNSFLTKDYPIVIAAVGDQFWPRLLKLFNHPELHNPKYATALERQKDKAKLEKIIQDELIKEKSDHWLRLLEEEAVPCARVNNIEQALNDQQVQHRNMLVDVPHPDGGSVKVPGNPIKFSESAEEEFLAPPLLGEHTKQVLNGWLGYSDEELESLDKLQIIEMLK